jgi:hypothetical protein
MLIPESLVGASLSRRIARGSERSYLGPPRYWAGLDYFTSSYTLC